MTTTIDAANIENITVVSPEISCAHCVMTVEKAVGALEGVSSVKANADTKQIDLAFDPQVVTLDRIAAVLDDAGYPIAQ